MLLRDEGMGMGHANEDADTPCRGLAVTSTKIIVKCCSIYIKLSITMTKGKLSKTWAEQLADLDDPAPQGMILFNEAMSFRASDLL